MARQVKIVRTSTSGASEANMVARTDAFNATLASEYANDWRAVSFVIGQDSNYYVLLEHD